MSASSKKKLRNAQEADKLTEKQLAEQNEAKKLKTYSTIFVVVIALMAVFAVYTIVSSTISHSGILERNTTALTVGEHEISNAELNYYFIDSINNFYNIYGSYVSLFGLDLTKPLDEQVINESTGDTWADDFMLSAMESVRSAYALNDAAAAAGFTLSDAESSEIDMQLSNLNAYGILYGYSGTEDYLKAMYGNGATEEGFRSYLEMSYIANSYQTYYAENLTYEDADLRAAEADNMAAFSAFSYHSYYIATSKFLKDGTTDESGVVTYTDEQREAARAEAEATAEALTAYTTAEELDAAIAALSINAEVENASSTAYTDTAYSSINTTVSDWVTDEVRKAGDTTAIAASSTATNDDGTETTTVNGYYVVLFQGSNDNNYPLVNIRHILISFENGVYDEATGTTVYADEDKEFAKNKAEALLAQWEAGEATEDSFIALVKDNSTDTGSSENGGLYEDVYPGQMVTNFNDWCFADGRKAGDTGIVESEYGYHVMFFSGNSQKLYRDLLIENTLVSEDVSEWYTALVEAMTLTELNTKYVNTSLVLSG